MVDVAVLNNQNRLRLERYQEQAFDQRPIHHVAVVVMPLVRGAFGTVSKDFAKWQEFLGILGITRSTHMSTDDLRKVLHLWAAGGSWDVIQHTHYELRAGENVITIIIKIIIIYNYPPKGKWIVVAIYRDTKRRGIYPSLFTNPEGDSCFSIYQIRLDKKMPLH